MLYLGIEQHKAQITVNLRNEQGDVIQQCQVSTDHVKIDEFFAGLKKQAARTKGFMAILEVCGFNHWLLKKLDEFGCKEIVLMQPGCSGRPLHPGWCCRTVVNNPFALLTGVRERNIVTRTCGLRSIPR